MPLRRRWYPLERDILRRIPDRYGVYELGDEDGTVIRVDHGPLRDSIKEALAYEQEVSQFRFTPTATREQAEDMVADHRDRL